MPTTSTSTKNPPDQLPSITTLSNFNVHYHNIFNDTQLLESINSCRSTTHHHHSRLLYILTDPSFIQRYSNAFSTMPTTTVLGALLQPSLTPVSHSLSTTGSNSGNGYKVASQQPSLLTTEASNMLPETVKLPYANMASVSLMNAQQQQQQLLFNNYYHPTSSSVSSSSAASIADTNMNMTIDHHYNNNTHIYDRLTNSVPNTTTLTPCIPPQPLLPPPQPSITKQSIAVTAVDDCCDACCPAIIHSIEDTRHNRQQQSTQTTTALVPCTLTHDEEATEESVVLPSIKGRKRSSSVSSDTLGSLSKKPKQDNDDSISISISSSSSSSNNNNNKKDDNLQVQKYSEFPDSSATRCQWSSCVAKFDSLDDLPEHLFQEHLNNLLNGKDLTVDTASASAASASAASASAAAASAAAAAAAAAAHDTETAVSAVATTVATDGRNINNSSSSSSSSNSRGSGHSGSPSSLTAAEEDYLLNCYWASCTEKFNVTESFIDHLYRQHLHFIQQQQQQQKQQQIQAAPILPSAPTYRTCYECHWLDCQQTFSELESLVVHLSTVHVTGQKNEYCCRWASCERAGKPFVQRQKLLRHLQTTHLGYKPFQCDVCLKRFSEARLMMQHKRTHTGEKPFACDQCDKRFSVASALTIHVRTLHSGEKPFICKYCDKRFPESSNLTKHMRVHTGEKPFKCSLCDAVFARPDQRARHFKSHHGKKR